jgi:exopolysaccharide production protein ExoZ
MQSRINRNVQCLRALAAYAVVTHHVIDALNNYIAHMDIRLSVGANGVDVFFVISGFIMAATTSSRSVSPAQFALNRIIRIVPIYWLLTLFAAGLLIAGFKLFSQSFNTIHLLKSLFFIADPHKMPVLFVGWSLNYEMMFYVLFSVCLFIRPTVIRLYALCSMIAAIWALGLLAPVGSIFGYVANSIILEFALGVLIWILSRSWMPSAPLAVVLGILGVAGLFIPDLSTLPSKTLATAPAACALVLSAVALEAKGLSIGNRWLEQQGDASYSIYLIHPFVLQIVGKAGISARLVGSAPDLCVVVGMMFITVALFGTLFHLFVERPLTNRLKSRQPFCRQSSRSEIVRASTADG